MFIFQLLKYSDPVCETAEYEYACLREIERERVPPAVLYHIFLVCLFCCVLATERKTVTPRLKDCTLLGVSRMRRTREKVQLNASGGKKGAREAVYSPELKRKCVIWGVFVVTGVSPGSLVYSQPDNETRAAESKAQREDVSV